jgi:chromosome segregation ATPase
MFKKRAPGDEGKSAKEQVAELTELIGTAREERAALSTMLTQVEMHGSKLSTLGRTLQEVNERAGGTAGKMDTLTTRLSTLEERATGLEKVEDRIDSLSGTVVKVEETAQRLLSPDGELQKHRLEVQQLSSQATQNVAMLDAMRKDQRTLDELRERLSVSQRELEEAATRSSALKSDFDRLGGVTGQLTQDPARLSDSLRETREQAAATIEAVSDVEKKLGPLAELHELSQSTDTRLSTLNSVAEHVMQKVKVL